MLCFPRQKNSCIAIFNSSYIFFYYCDFFRNILVCAVMLTFKINTQFFNALIYYTEKLKIPMLMTIRFYLMHYFFIILLTRSMKNVNFLVFCCHCVQYFSEITGKPIIYSSSVVGLILVYLLCLKCCECCRAEMPFKCVLCHLWNYDQMCLSGQCGSRKTQQKHEKKTVQCPECFVQWWHLYKAVI